MTTAHHFANRHRRPFVGGLIALMLVLQAAAATSPAAELNVIPLAGKWQFAMDPADQGVEENWPSHDLPGTIQLPGSMVERGLGNDITVNTPWTGAIVDRSFFTDDRYAPYRQPGHVKVPFWLTPRKHYVGAAWYRRAVEVPVGWRGQRILLRLERAHWGTTLWWDDAKVGSADSLSTPHVYDLTKIATPGQHWITVRVDNRLLAPVGVNAHSVSDHTQGNWNGLIGELKLVCTPRVWIEDVQVYPDVAAKTARLRVTLGNLSDVPQSATLRLQAATITGSPPHRARPLNQQVTLAAGLSTVEVAYPLGSKARLWDEFSPNVYELVADLTPDGEAAARPHEYRTTFGLRELGQEGTQFTVNGRRIFLRGTLECCIFPYTGHPPTAPAYWRKILRAARAHGLNHLRFHSWCPPEAAFRVADELGFYFHIECAAWGNVDDPALRAFIIAEADRILRAYGNHPSFCFLAYGNEPGGRSRKQWLGELVNSWKAKDPRHKYTSAAGWPIIPENDFHSSPAPRIQRWGQGLKSRINARPPETVTDYSGFIARHNVPVVSHEIGQWCVYPNLKERAKYTGVMQALNFDIFADSLAANGLADLADDFLYASGKLQALCYKEEIESALRTAGMGGFQLLDLHDFPGQGTALVGVLDPFWEEKGYITAAEYRRFCNATVPLALLPKRVFRAGEELTARVKIAHFGPTPLQDARVSWWLADTNGTQLVEGEFPKQSIPIGNEEVLGEIKAVLPESAEAHKYVLNLAIAGTPFHNDWDVWAYPEAKRATLSPNYVYWRTATRSGLGKRTLEILKNGGRVFLHMPPALVAGDEHGPVATGFSSIFWNTAWTHRQAPHTLGILCDPAHPAFKHFPTEAYSNWQWWYLIHNAQAMILDDLPRELKPLVRVIDDWVTNRRLALAFEAKVGNGSVLVSSMDIWPEGLKSSPSWQLGYSFESYMASEAFDPKVTLTVGQLESLLHQATFLERLGAYVRRTDSFQSGHEPRLAIDGDPKTMWHTAWGEGAPGFPHQLEIGFKQWVKLDGIRLVPRNDNNHNGWIKGYRIEVSDGSDEWTTVAEGELPDSAKPPEIRFPKPVKATALRLTTLSGHSDGPWASLAELELIPAGN